MKVQKKIIFLLLGLIFVTLFIIMGANFFGSILFPVCAPVSPSTTNCLPGNKDSKINLTTKEAVEKGFPIYLPSSESIELMELTYPPQILFKSHGSTCSYLEIPIYRIREEKPTITMFISNGCAFPISSSMYVNEVSLAWAENGKAYVVENPNSMLVIKEPNSGFQYLVSFEGSLTLAIDLLQSMQYMDEQ